MGGSGAGRRVPRSVPRRVRALAAALIAAGAGAGAAHAEAGGAGSDGSASWAADPVHVHYAGAHCRGDTIEVQVWDRDARRWIPHPAHPRFPVPSCQVEDAGVLLNELRWRCVEPPGPAADAAPWIVGLDVFDPEVMSRCAVEQIASGERRTAISVSSPGEGVPVRAPQPVVPVEGSVRVDGLEGSAYEVVIAIDRSAAATGGPDPLAAQIRAARAFVERMAPRMRADAVRVALVSYPNLPPGPGESSGARRDQGLTDDPAAALASLAALPRRPVASLPTLTSALELALDELEAGRAGARGVVVAGFDGREAAGVGTGSERAEAPLRHVVERAARRGVALHLFALGGLAEEAPRVLADAIARGRGSFARVLSGALETDFLGGVELPVAEDVWIESPARGGARVQARLEAGGRFRARVPVEAGANALRIHARTSDGSETSRGFELVFDDTLILERILEAERERMRRAQRKRLDLDVERDTAP